MHPDLILLQDKTILVLIPHLQECTTYTTSTRLVDSTLYPSVQIMGDFFLAFVIVHCLDSYTYSL